MASDWGPSCSSCWSLISNPHLASTRLPALQTTPLSSLHSLRLFSLIPPPPLTKKTTTTAQQSSFTYLINNSAKLWPTPLPPPPTPPTITTPRLTLIPPDPANTSHADFIVELYNTPEFIASIGGKPTSITTREASQAYIANRFAKEHARNGYGTWLVVLNEHEQVRDAQLSSSCSAVDGTVHEEKQEEEEGGGGGGKIVGTVSLTRGPPESGSYAAPDLGFAVLPAFCRRGIATEASRALLAWIASGLDPGVDFVVLGLHDPANRGSAAVLRGLGFERKGLRKLSAFGGVIGLVWVLKLGAQGSADGVVREDEVRALGLPAEDKVPAGVA
ncbi:[ribosomal protein S5]-alanine N-acetyltransferase [Microdochium nivale]|nr:[ribosomal protein S5]-alanine N-acetyltransferase [Microdochium nivale]